MTLELWYVAVALAAALVTRPLVIAAEGMGRRLGFVDRPRAGEMQTQPLPRTGGYAVLLGFWFAIALSFGIAPPTLAWNEPDLQRILGVALGSLLLIPLAVVDDARRLGPWPQLGGQILAATIPVLFGVSMQQVASPWGLVDIPPGLAGPLAVLWIVAMINAINLLDAMDGLAGGVTAIASAVLFFRSSWFAQASIAVIPAALGGTCLGFLTRNWHPARIILGSSGALFLGYMLGVVTLLGGVKIGTAFLVLAVPILDVVWVIYRRLSHGRSPFRGGDAEHLPHRLHQLGLPVPVIVLLFYGVCGAIGVAVLVMHEVAPGVEKAALAAGVIAAVVAGLVLVARAGDRRRSRDRSL